MEIRSQKPAETTLGRVALKAGAWYLISQIIIRGLTFLTTPIFTRLLSTDQYGVVRVYESWIDMLLPVFGLCIYQSMSRAKLDYEDEYYQYHSSVQALVFLFCGILAAVLLTFRKTAEYLLSMNTVMLVTLLCYMPMLSAVVTYQNREKQLMRYKSNVLIMALCAVPATLLSIAAVWYFKAHSAADLANVRIVSFYAPQILVGLVVSALVFIRGGFTVKLSHWRYALKFSFPLIPHLLSMYVLSQCDKLMIKSMCGDTYAAIFSLAVTLQYVLYIIIDAIEGSWVPWLFEKLAARDSDDPSRRGAYNKAIAKPFTAMMLGAAALSLIIELASPELIALLGGPPYAEARYIVAPLLMNTLFAFGSRLYVSIEKYNKKTLLTAVCTMIVAAVNIPLNYIFIKKYGYIAAAYTTAFCYMLLLLIHAAVVRLLIKENCIHLPLPLGVTLCCGALFGLIMLLYGVKGGVIIRYGLIVLILGAGCCIFRRQIAAFLTAKFKNISSKSTKNGANTR